MQGTLGSVLNLNFHTEFWMGISWPITEWKLQDSLLWYNPLQSSHCCLTIPFCLSIARWKWNWPKQFTARSIWIIQICAFHLFQQCRFKHNGFSMSFPTSVSNQLPSKFADSFCISLKGSWITARNLASILSSCSWIMLNKNC